MNIKEFKQALFADGVEAGFSEMELYYEREETFHCELFEGDIDEYSTSEVFGISFRGLYEGKMGTSFTEKLALDSIPFLLESAKENALILDEEEKEQIFEGSPHYGEANFYSQDLAEVPIPQMIQLLKDIERYAREEDPKVTGLDALGLTNTETERALYNTKGVERIEKHNYMELMLSVVIKEGDVIKNAGITKYTKDIQSFDVKKIAAELVQEALEQLGPKGIESKSYPVLLRRDTASALLHTFSPVFSAEKAQKGQSLLKDQLGKEVAVSQLTIVDDPFLSDGVLSRTFDHEGVATNRIEIVKDGVICTLLHNQKTAEKAGIKSTGHGYKDSYKGSLSISPTNMYVKPGTHSFEGIISQLKEGVLITELAGLHSGANQVSGDFSFAANGFYIKDGKILTAVNQMTIAGNFYSLLKGIEMIGKDVEFALSYTAPGYIGSPSLLINSLDVTVE